MSLNPSGSVRYRLKTPCRNCTMHVIFELLDFIARLAALVPRLRVNLTRFHGVFAPSSKSRVRVKPARRGRGAGQAATTDPEERTPSERHASITWAQRLQRAFGVNIETCPACGGTARTIACIEDPVTIEKNPSPLDAKAAEAEALLRPPCRAPPQRRLFDWPVRPQITLRPRHLRNGHGTGLPGEDGARCSARQRCKDQADIYPEVRP